VNGLRELSLGGTADAANAGAFLARVTRLDAGALVRIRAAEPGLLTLWAWSPLDVLVARSVAGNGPDDVTVGAAALLTSLVAVGAADGSAELALPRRQDAEWRGSLPPFGSWRVLDTVPVPVIRDLIVAGVRAFGEVTRPESGQSVAGMRAVGESLLDHATLRVSAGPAEVTVPFRVLMALRRMDFLGPEPVDAAVDPAGTPHDGVEVALLGPWLRVSAAFGAVYRRRDPALFAR
jgi:hypothetical protein